MNSFARRSLIPAAAAIVTIAAAAVAWSADRQACPAAREFSDSLASNRIRLKAVDSVLAGFDLAQGAVPVRGDMAQTNDEPNRLERRIIALRMEGVTAPQLDRWLRDDVHLTLRPADGGTKQLALIHSRETDSAYVEELHADHQVTYDLWHDMTVVPPLTSRWTARCSAYQREMMMVLSLWAVAVAALSAWAWRRRIRPGQ
jgi:hypothetical protein